jgi:hypothetical protein
VGYGRGVTVGTGAGGGVETERVAELAAGGIGSRNTVAVGVCPGDSAGRVATSGACASRGMVPVTAVTVGVGVGPSPSRTIPQAAENTSSGVVGRISRCQMDCVVINSLLLAYFYPKNPA